MTIMSEGSLVPISKMSLKEETALLLNTLDVFGWAGVMWQCNTSDETINRSLWLAGALLYAMTDKQKQLVEEALKKHCTTARSLSMLVYHIRAGKIGSKSIRKFRRDVIIDRLVSLSPRELKSLRYMQPSLKDIINIVNMSERSTELLLSKLGLT